MYKISSIISLREIQRQPFRDVVYEWEDYISIHDNIPINNQKNVSITTHSNPSIYKKIESYLIKKQVCRRIDFSKPICIAFITMIKDIVYIQDKNCIPIFLDIWNKEIDFLLYKMRKGSPFFVTSMDVYQKIKEKRKTANVHYIPLTVSDKWVTNDEIKKNLDILQVGRKNQVLHEYALKYISTHPNVEYVYSGENGTNGDLEYYSTKGRSIKPAKTRTDYMELLKSANICLLSSPGADASRKWAEDIDFPTPRFYETAVAQCHMIARLTDRLEFKEQGITDICKIVDNYESFEKILDEILSSGKKIDREIYSQFINRHVTSNWYVMLKKKLEVLQ